ncbi:MAG: hypothetical protein AAF581_12920 [Planctomycetota bacterium]
MNELLSLAYLDPGSGSIILQTAIAMIFSAGIFCRRWIASLLAPFTRRKQQQDAGTAGTEQSQEP